MDRKFNSAYSDKRNSSLCNTQSVEFMGNVVNQILSVSEFPPTIILDQIKDAGFEFVESLKIDAEGCELEVLKESADKIIKILYCRVEHFKDINCNSDFSKPNSLFKYIKFSENGLVDSVTEIFDYLKNFNFQIIFFTSWRLYFFKYEPKHLLIEYELCP